MNQDRFFYRSYLFCSEDNLRTGQIHVIWVPSQKAILSIWMEPIKCLFHYFCLVYIPVGKSPLCLQTSLEPLISDVTVQVQLNEAFLKSTDLFFSNLFSEDPSSLMWSVDLLWVCSVHSWASGWVGPGSRLISWLLGAWSGSDGEWWVVLKELYLGGQGFRTIQILTVNFVEMFW